MNRAEMEIVGICQSIRVADERGLLVGQTVRPQRREAGTRGGSESGLDHARRENTPGDQPVLAVARGGERGCYGRS